MKLLLVDNFDSFTFNLYHFLLNLGKVEVDVVRNNQLDNLDGNKYHGFVLSPGPGLPCMAGGMPRLIEKFSKEKPFLGVCLGHQGLGEFFGAKLENLENIHHGVTRKTIHNENSIIFENVPVKFNSARYHSWGFKQVGFPICLNVTSQDEAGIVMSFEHKELPITGIQFHPESILTEYGQLIIDNWIHSIG